VNAKQNPASLAAGRAPSSFCLPAERAENNRRSNDTQARRDHNREARLQASIVEWARTVAPDWAEAGRLSEVQRDIHERLAALGTRPAVVRSVADVREAFKAWRIETREAARG
jgi:hypothetical protein